MTSRTFAIGDIHGDLDHLERLLRVLPPVTEADTLVFLGDYVDRGPDSAGVVRYLMNLPEQTAARVIYLRGNHEDGWLRTIEEGWPNFVIPPGNGCLQAMESFLGREISEVGTAPEPSDFETLVTGDFFPTEVLEWMESLHWWHEDEFAIYVHAGLQKDESGDWLHPSDVAAEDRTAMLWHRSRDFLENYRGKPVVVGHTVTEHLPQELSTYTPDDPTDLWAGDSVMAIDTGCGKGGFLTAVEFPAMLVHESRAG